MNNSNETPLATELRNWFKTPNKLHSEHILAKLDLINIMVQFRFGNRMINEALTLAEELRDFGEMSEAKDIEGEVFVMRVNLNKVKGAYDLAMN